MDGIAGSSISSPLSKPNLHLKLVLPFKSLIRTFPPSLKRIRRIKCILHKLHIRHLPLLDFRPDTERTGAFLAQGTGAVRKAAEDGYILVCSEDGKDLEILSSPDLVDGGEGVEDGLGTFLGVVAGVGEDLF